MRSALLIAQKDLFVLSRDRVALFWVFVFPLSFALFFGAVLESSIERMALAPRDPNAPSGYLRSLPAGVLWGLMTSAATFAVALVSERSRGTLQRLRAAPHSSGAILAGKALACLLACLLVAGLLVSVAIVGFDARIERPFAVIAVAVSAAIGFVGLTMLLGVSGKTEQAVAGAGWAVLLGFAMLGGAMVPSSLMPEWLQDLGTLSPVRWALRALEIALWQDGELGELFRHCAPLLLLGTAGVALAALALRRTA
jgi:ABC-2 type transport system permease protein